MIRHLFVPGLFGPVPAIEHYPWPAVPRLEALLARAERDDEPVGYAAGLLRLFGITPPPGADLPTAALAFLGDTGERPPGFVLHADPLQLLPDRDQLLAFTLDDDPLDDDEIACLVAAFNTHFSADGVRLHGGPGGHIYLLSEAVPTLQTHPLAGVIGRNLDPFLPQGQDQRTWRGLLNETQMLCHSLDLNRAREALGRPSLGGLWFSGGGILPAAQRTGPGRLTGECVLARGGVALGGGPGADELVVEHAFDKAVRRADTAAWMRALADLEARLAGLQDGASLHVHAGNGDVYRWQARSARRWWRRRRPLLDYVAGDR